jgi:hypothetical protein
MRSFAGTLAAIAALIFAGCGAPAINWNVAIGNSDQAMREGSPLYAYLNLRNTWMTAPPEFKAAAIAKAKQYPVAVAAGYRDLAAESVKRPRDSRFPQWLAFHRELAPVDEAQLAADITRLDAEHQAELEAKAKLEAQSRAARDAELKVQADARAARDAEARAKDQAELAEANRRRDVAMPAAVFRCRGALGCEKAFSLAQIFVNEKSDMKIQIATNTIVETYSPTDAGKLGMKVMKIPLSGDEAELRLTVACKPGAREISCVVFEANTYEQFPLFMKARYRQ